MFREDWNYLEIIPEKKDYHRTKKHETNEIHSEPVLQRLGDQFKNYMIVKREQKYSEARRFGGIANLARDERCSKQTRAPDRIHGIPGSRLRRTQVDPIHETDLKVLCSIIDCNTLDWQTVKQVRRCYENREFSQIDQIRSGHRCGIQIAKYFITTCVFNIKIINYLCLEN